jgi:twitching motility protein PilT
MVSKSVRGVVAQQLIPCKDGEGLALALEIVVFTPAIAMMIQEGKTHQLASAIQSGRRLGMKLMDESLQELARQNVIEAAEAWARAENKEMFQSGRGS